MALISQKNCLDVHENFTRDEPDLWTRKTPLNFGSHPDSDPDSRSLDSGFGRRSALSK